MRHWLHRTPFLMALLWCGAVSALWARSYVVCDTLGRLWMTRGNGSWADHRSELISSGGVVRWKWDEQVRFEDSEEHRQRREWSQRGLYLEHEPFEPLINSPPPEARAIEAFNQTSRLPLKDGTVVGLGGMGGAAWPHWLLLLPGVGAAAATFGPARRNASPRRWRRALARVAVAIPLLLLVAATAFWLASGWLGFRFERQESSSDGVVRDQRNTNVEFAHGALLVVKARSAKGVEPLAAGKPGIASRGNKFYSMRQPTVLTTPAKPALGFGYSAGPAQVGNSPGTARVYAAPLWAPPVITLPFAGWSAWHIRRARQTARRRRLGECVRCGYDLRSSSERCPECGEAIPAGQGALA